MAFTEGANDGALNGTTEVTIVAAPASSTRRVVTTITIYNKDTAAVTVELRYKASSTRIMAKPTLQVGDTFIFGGGGEVEVLDSTSKSITAVMSGAAATNNPEFTAAYGDST